MMASILQSDMNITLLVLVLSVLSVIFSITEVSKCDLIRMSTSVRGKDFLEMGLFSRALYDTNGDNLGCIDYTQIEPNGVFRVGRAFGVLLSMMSLLSMICFYAGSLFFPSHILWNTARFSVGLATISQMFVFLVLADDLCSENECHLSSSGILGIFNAFVLAGLTIVSVRTDCPQYPLFCWYKDQSDQATSSGLERPDVDARSVWSGPWFTTIFAKHTTRVRIIFFFAALTSWIFSILGMSRCTLIMVSDELVDEEFRGMGLFRRGAYFNGEMIGCVEYPSRVKSTFGIHMDASRTFATLAVFFLLMILSLLVVTAFLQHKNDQIWLCVQWLLVASTVSESLILLIYGSNVCTNNDRDVECVPGGVGILVFFNLGILMVLSFAAFYLPFPETPLLQLYQPSMSDDTTIKPPPVPQVFPFSYALRRQLSVLREVDEEESRGDNTHVSDTSHDDVRIEVRVEFKGNEKRTIKEITHGDGSKTVTTTVQDLEDDMDDSDDEEEEYEFPSYEDVVMDATETPVGANNRAENEAEVEDTTPQVSFDATRARFEQKKKEYHMHLREEKPKSTSHSDYEQRQVEKRAGDPIRSIQDTDLPEPVAKAKVWLARKRFEPDSSL